MGYFENYSDEEIQNIIKFSTSFKDFARKIGYSNSPSGDTIKMLQEKLKNYNTSHFYTSVSKEKRTYENTFIQNSTASQHTLRRFYLEGNYSVYECSICHLQPVWNGKELILILDHINGINNDDRLDNLRWVCPNCNQQLETTGSKNPQRKTFAKKYFCVDCGKEISKNSKRCEKCCNLHKTIPLDKMPITREELKLLIRTDSFLSIGKRFDKSDNTIRKWCIKFGLPSKKKDINKYTDKEWEEV